MKTLSEKKNIGTIIILLVILIGAFLYYQKNNNKDFTIEKCEIEYKDLKKLDSIQKKLIEQNDKILTKIKDPIHIDFIVNKMKDAQKKDSLSQILLKQNATIATQINNQLDENLKTNQNEYRKLQGDKNKDLFKYIMLVFQNEKSVLVLIIIIVCGLLGGLSSNFYKYLKDTIPLIESVNLKINLLSQNISRANVQDDCFELNEKIQKLTAEINSLQIIINEENKTFTASILFGILASFLSILILNATNSDVLKFETFIDYFIFACYCLLSSLFAKRIIESLIKTVIK
ncbi:hypothetical protein MQX03_11730 [Chryseobacterium aahli]|uniref:YEATS-associated helix-containing protein n=1 Tax=Chryseobacterium aahli TaxID=1278643 RepID=UPI001F615540|nr:YEATS-associated helix-containing protein [Chryseobacterium aahli]MCI3937873.1 hypothetical protein [Chryseobacterium aahli]